MKQLPALADLMPPDAEAKVVAVPKTAEQLADIMVRWRFKTAALAQPATPKRTRK